MVLLIDHFDSFTWNIYHYIQMCGQACTLVREDEGVIDAIEKAQPAGIVLSPGPMRPENHPVMQEVLQMYHKQLPMLGICLGHQAIGVFFGAKLVKGSVPVHGKVSEIKHCTHPMYSEIPGSLQVARYHSLVLAGLEDTPLEITAQTGDGLPMSLAHKELPLWGVQYHPEAIQTEYGLQLLKNWIAILN
jgi:anthranilate synthase/aminodeoxychorismate synthase-like glutamine amidotransferase